MTPSLYIGAAKTHTDVRRALYYFTDIQKIRLHEVGDTFLTVWGTIAFTSMLWNDKSPTYQAKNNKCFILFLDIQSIKAFEKDLGEKNFKNVTKLLARYGLLALCTTLKIIRCF